MIKKESNCKRWEIAHKIIATTKSTLFFKKCLVTNYARNVIPQLICLLLLYIFAIPTQAMFNGDEDLSPKVEEKRFVVYVMPTSEVLVPLEHRREFGPTVFELANTGGSLVDYLSNGLFRERIQRLLNYLGFLDYSPSLDIAEREYLEHMIEAGENLVLYTHPHALIDRHPFYISSLQQFTEAAFRYLHHRVIGINRHLNTGNVQIHYQHGFPISRDGGSIVFGSGSTPCFEEHKSKQKAAMDLYFRQRVVQNIIKKLRFLTPSLRLDASNAEEFLVEKRNSYEEPFTNFTAPPALDSISSGLTALSGCLPWTLDKREEKKSYAMLSENRKALQETVYSLANIRDFLNIYDYFKILSYIEHLAQAPLNHRQWSPHQKEFWLNQPVGILMGIMNFIPYRYIDIDDNKKAEQQRIIADKFVSQREQIEARRHLRHYSIQWSRLKRLGLLVFHARKFNRPFHNEILLEASSELIPEIERIILPRIEAWINFELAVSAKRYEEMKSFDSMVDTSLTPTLSLLGDYAADVAYLTKLQETTEAVMNVDSLPIEATIRVLTILGECSKNFSGFVKNNLGEEQWDRLAIMRNMLLHSHTYHRKMVKALEENKELSTLLLKDFQVLKEHIQAQLNGLPTTWGDIKNAYSSPGKISEFRMEGIKQLLDIMDPIVSPEDYALLMATKPKASRIADLQIHRNAVHAALQSVDAAYKIEQTTFVEHLNQLNLLTKGEQKKLLEFYKKLRKLGKEGVTKEDDKTVEGHKACEAILVESKFKPKPDENWELEVEGLVKKLKGFTGEKELSAEGGHEDQEIKIERNLAVELNRLGISDQKPWEVIRRKIHAKKSKGHIQSGVPTKELSPQGHISEVLQDSMAAITHIMEHLQSLDKLTTKPQEYLGRTKLDDFWNNPKIFLSAEYHIEMIRQYVGVIEEAILYLIRHDIWWPYTKELNDFYHILSLKLKNIRLEGNYFAHLHDVAEFETHTPYGVRLSLFGQVINHVDGFPYGGREGQPIQHLSSLRKELEGYTALLGPSYEKASDAASYTSVSPTDVIATYDATFIGQAIRLEEHNIPGDGNCGFTGLGLTRSASIEQLIGHLNDPLIAEMVRDDVREAFQGRDLPPKLMAKVQDLAKQINEQDETIAAILAPLNDQYAVQYEGHRLTIEEMIEDLGRGENTEAIEIRDLLVAAQRRLDDLYRDVGVQLDPTEALAEFLREEFLRSGRYLSYVREHRGTLYALAHINNLEVHIWTNDGPGRLVETFTVPARIQDATTRVIHLHHTNYGAKLNHFNSLKIVPTPHLAITPSVANTTGDGVIQHTQLQIPSPHIGLSPITKL